jgi:hypothetical protein
MTGSWKQQGGLRNGLASGPSRDKKKPPSTGGFFHGGLPYCWLATLFSIGRTIFVLAFSFNTSM